MYENVYEFHTMCMEDVATGVTPDENTRNAIVQQHNDFREDVSPIAGDMTKMVSAPTLRQTVTDARGRNPQTLLHSGMAGLRLVKLQPAWSS